MRRWAATEAVLVLAVEMIRWELCTRRGLTGDAAGY